LQTIAIIGAGPLGRWLALAAARAGYRVFLEDVMPSNLHHAQEVLRHQLTPEGLDGSASRQGSTSVEPNRLQKEQGALAPAAISYVSTVEDAVREADLVIDCVPDELESKLEILWLLDRMAPPKTVIATPTTNLSIVDLAGCTYRPEKCIAIAADPRALTDQRPGSTIELRTTPRTTPETAALVEQFWNRLGFHPAVEPAAAPAEN
jgi:3-hydroxybutyryl-CoA dehydrogenase